MLAFRSENSPVTGLCTAATLFVRLLTRLLCRFSLGVGGQLAKEELWRPQPAERCLGTSIAPSSELQLVKETQMQLPPASERTAA